MEFGEQPQPAVQCSGLVKVKHLAAEAIEMTIYDYWESVGSSYPPTHRYILLSQIGWNLPCL